VHDLFGRVIRARYPGAPTRQRFVDIEFTSGRQDHWPQEIGTGSVWYSLTQSQHDTGSNLRHWPNQLIGTPELWQNADGWSKQSTIAKAIATGNPGLQHTLRLGRTPPLAITRRTPDTNVSIHLLCSRIFCHQTKIPISRSFVHFNPQHSLAIRLCNGSDIASGFHKTAENPTRSPACCARRRAPIPINTDEIRK
jgi:hypothetical protein